MRSDPSLSRGALAGTGSKATEEASSSDLAPEKVALVAAHLVIHKERPRSEVLAPFGLSEPEWEIANRKLMRRMVEEVRERSGSDAPIEERYPVSTAYAKVYATAMREARQDVSRSEDEATIRLAPNTPTDEPFSVLGASNRAASQRRY